MQRVCSLGAAACSAMSKRARHAGREAQLETAWDEYCLRELANQMPARRRGVSVLHKEAASALLGYCYTSYL